MQTYTKVGNPKNLYKFAPNKQQHYFITMAHRIDPDACVACGSCIDECPLGAISAGDVYSIDPDTCADCGTCVDACPNGAISAQ